ncbi:MAG: hypothetical protein ABIA04_14190 [Pseudomonadota bacterium]
MKSDKFDCDQIIEKFDEFDSIKTDNIPEHIENSILDNIFKETGKDKLKAIIFVSAIHVFIGTLIIAVCPQFEIRLHHKFNGLLNVFMLFGPHVCSFLCGSLFLSATIVFSELVLPKTYKYYLYSIRFYKIPFLIVASLIVFNSIKNIDLNLFTFLWILGAFTASNFVYLLKTKI